MSKKYLIANWKMNPTSSKAAQRLAGQVVGGYKELKNSSNVEVVLCPPHVYIPAVKEENKNKLPVGGQNCHFEKSGAFTGEVSPEMLKELGCKYVIVGHSERRQYFKEDGELINKKMKAVLSAGMVPVLAVGEESRESFDAQGRFSGELDPVIKEQLVDALNGISTEKAKKIIIAYEPVWAIGTGNAASPDDVFSAKLFIKKVLRDLYGKGVESAVPVLYGGSTDSKNVKSFIEEAEMDGALVGGASLKAQEFVKMIKELS